MSAPLVIGELIIATGRCGSCGIVRAAFINRDGRTCCAVCAARRASVILLALVLMFLPGCGSEFHPIYEGEPNCGSRNAIHAQERALCDGAVMVACTCDDRISLECVNGLWVFEHDGCSAGLGVSTAGDAQ